MYFYLTNQHLQYVAAEMLTMPKSSLTYTDAEWARVLERIQPSIDNPNALPIQQRIRTNIHMWALNLNTIN